MVFHCPHLVVSKTRNEGALTETDCILSAFQTKNGDEYYKLRSVDVLEYDLIDA